MKKYLCSLLATFFLIITLCACGNGGNFTSAEICDKVLSICSEDLSWSQLDTQQAAKYYGIKTELLHDFCVYISKQDDRYDTVAVFSFNTPQERTELAKAISGTIKTNETTVQAINDTEYKKIQSRIVMELKDKLIFVISDMTAEITDMLTKLGATAYIA